MVECCNCGILCDELSHSYTTSGRCFKCDTGEFAALKVIHQCAWCSTILAPTPFRQGEKLTHIVPNASHGVCKPCSMGLRKQSKQRKRKKQVVLMHKVAQKFLSPIFFVIHSL